MRRRLDHHPQPAVALGDLDDVEPVQADEQVAAVAVEEGTGHERARSHAVGSDTVEAFRFGCLVAPDLGRPRPISGSGPQAGRSHPPQVRRAAFSQDDRGLAGLDLAAQRPGAPPLDICLLIRQRAGHGVIGTTQTTAGSSAGSTGRRNTSRSVEVINGSSTVGGRPGNTAESCVRPAIRNSSVVSKRRSWQQIATGLLPEEAAALAGVAQAMGSRWFHNAGGRPPFDITGQPWATTSPSPSARARTAKGPGQQRARA